MAALKKLYGYYLYLWIGLPFFFLFPIFYLLLSRKSWYPLAHRLRVFWSWIPVVLGGYWFTRKQDFAFDKNRGYVICFNHSSHLDIPLLALCVPTYFRFMAKAELSKVPLLNIFFRTIDISVERQNPESARKAYDEACQSLHEGISIAIAPEGATQKNPPKLGNFKSGAFRMAIENQVPILPVTMLDNWLILPSKSKWQGPKLSRCIVHEPIETKGMLPEDYQALSNQVHTLFENDLKAAFPQNFV